MIGKNHPEVEVLLTRDNDVFIPLFRRIQFANEEKADLFISIHCNFISSPSTRGTETFVMGLHRAEENLAVAKEKMLLYCWSTTIKRIMMVMTLIV